MSDFHDVSINLLSALIGLTAGWARGAAANRLRYRHARGLWRQLAGPTVNIVVGAHSVTGWETAGLMGIGDAFAVSELQQHLVSIGAGQPKIIYGGRLEAETRRNDLILIGGPDTNSMTREVMKRLAGTFKFLDPPAHTFAIRDAHGGKTYDPDPPTNGEGTDFGVLVRAVNPFNPEASVLIVAGAYGLGTWAGARLVHSKAFMQEPLVRAMIPFECLFETDVVASTPQATKILALRSLDVDPAAIGGSAVI
ncbi:hypothetical protein Caci_5103 [Catenulispora acidiphila DSM 44928]|uniref:S-layer protein C-terminal domain-containing protein n=1 Tax=Catenulispora acidiphila (strain DSM 44928 / JCM 14897 / NBRC 102108 / NRRL B-24433 / ID139908) TaxID=479433 RepID=C7Q515_CATAD|nr:hypothetical protein [Catenulispora acidiphila]ACU73963.1 hypothetical protein Caci_5103 [Catenulispora acidiphila DSM 44928]